MVAYRRTDPPIAKAARIVRPINARLTTHPADRVVAAGRSIAPDSGAAGAEDEELAVEAVTA